MSKFKRILALIMTVTMLCAVLPSGLTFAAGGTEDTSAYNYVFRCISFDHYTIMQVDVSNKTGGPHGTDCCNMKTTYGITTIDALINWLDTNAPAGYNALIRIVEAYGVDGDEVWDPQNGSVTVAKFYEYNNANGNDQYYNSCLSPSVIIAKQYNSWTNDPNKHGRSLTVKANVTATQNGRVHWFYDVRDDCVLNLHEGSVLIGGRVDSLGDAVNDYARSTGVRLYENATCNMYGGIIKDNKIYDEPAQSSAVYLDGNSVFNMYGGTITGNEGNNGTKSRVGAVFAEGNNAQINIGYVAGLSESQPYVYGNYETNVRLGVNTVAGKNVVKYIGVMGPLVTSTPGEGIIGYSVDAIEEEAIIARGVNGYVISDADYDMLNTYIEYIPEGCYLEHNKAENYVIVKRRHIDVAVKTYYENPTTRNYDLDSTVSVDGYFGMTKTISPASTATHNGWNYNLNSGKSTLSILVKDGYNELSVYYSLGDVSYSDVYYYRNSTSDSYTRYVASTGSGAFGSTVNKTSPDLWTYGGKTYKLDSTGNVTSIVLNATGLELKHYYTLNAVSYSVNHYVMDTNGNYPTVPTQVTTGVGDDGQTVNATPLTFDNCNVNTTISKMTITLKTGSGNVMSIYYARSKADYNLVVHTEKAEGGYDVQSSKLGNDYVGKKITYSPDRTKDGLTLDESADKQALWTTTITPDGKAEIHVYYNISKTSYTVTYYYMDTDGKYQEDKTDTFSDQAVGTTVNAATPAKTDFTVNTAKSTLSIKLDKDASKNKMYVYYDRNQAGYQVITYVMNFDGTTYTSSTTSTGTAYIGKTVSVTPDDIKDGRKFMAGKSTTSVVITSGTNVIELYYDLVGELTITSSNVTDSQATVYTVRGEGLVFDVSLVGNTTKTIKNLPIGEYTVTPKNTWSWRYADLNNQVKTLDVSNNFKANATFSYAIQITKWLSYCINSIFN